MSQLEKTSAPDMGSDRLELFNRSWIADAAQSDYVNRPLFRSLNSKQTDYNKE